MLIHRIQKSAETEICCTKDNHSAHTVVYGTTLSATRPLSRQNQLVWRVGRIEPRILRFGRRTFKINPEVYYNNTGSLFWLANITGCFRALFQFVVSWDPCVATNIALFILFLSHVPFCFQIYYRIPFQDPKVHGASVVPTSQIRMSAMFLLLVF
jgi:hypothetical protein